MAITEIVPLFFFFIVVCLCCYLLRRCSHGSYRSPPPYLGVQARKSSPYHLVAQARKSSPYNLIAQGKSSPDSNSQRRRSTECVQQYSVDLKSVVECIVKKFKNYRLGTWEFAVLFAFPTEDTFQWPNLVEKYCIKSLDIYDVSPFYYDSKLFIAARPVKNEKHAEVVILDKLREWMSHDANVLVESKAIVLYSWILPCLKCQKVIRRNLSPYSNAKTTVLYTIPNETTIPSIKGIDIHQVDYDCYLPPPEQL